MEITEDQYARIAPYLPVQRGNVSLSNLQVLNAILYVAEHGCKWRGLPARYGNWHTIYMRMNRWSKSGVLDRVFERRRSCASDGSGVAGQHHRQGAKKNGPQSIGRSRGGWTTKLHMVAADARTAVTFSLSPGQAHDGFQAAALQRAGPARDGAYEGDATRQLLSASKPLLPGVNDRSDIQAAQRNRSLFRRLKGFRRIFSRQTRCAVPGLRTPHSSTMHALV